MTKWSRAYSPKRRYGMMTTNIAESLNKCMMKARRFSITIAHEFLRHMLQKWYNDRRCYAEKLRSSVTKTVEDHVNSMANESTSAIVTAIQQPIQLGVEHELGYGFVQPLARICSCRHWDLDQLPCHHAIAVARYNYFILLIFVL